MSPKRTLLEACLKHSGWKPDRWGHWQKTVPRAEREPRRLRVKLQDLSCRIEVRSSDGSSWIRMGGEYYSKLVELPDGRLRVGTYFLALPKEV